MSAQFDVVAGSVQGLLHRQRGTNNQDAYSIFTNEELIIAVVCDGCGSTPHAEVGAQLGSKFLANALAKQFTDPKNLDDDLGDPTAIGLDRCHGQVIDFLNSTAGRMSQSGNLAEIVYDYLLFTIVGCVITPDLATFFSIGDGVAAVNGQMVGLGPFPGNAPPFIGYNLVVDVAERLREEIGQFRVVKQLPTSELDTFLIGCDGVTHLAGAADKRLPGSNTLVGPLEQFWTEDRYFTNPQTLQRKLNVINSSRNVIDPITQTFICQDHGLLTDDTTMIVGRRTY